MKKGKMRNKTFLSILIPINVILLAFAIALPMIASPFRVLLDNRLGRGEKVIERLEGTEAWDTDYYTTVQDSKTASEQVALNINREGEVLLKNNGLLPLDQGTVMVPFGNAYLNPVYSGSGAGSSSSEGAVTPKAALSAFFTVNDAAERAMNGATPVEVAAAPGTRDLVDTTCLQQPASILAEYDPSIYSGLSAADGSVGIVFIGRTGFEGGDSKYDGYADGTPHYLALSENERGAIRAAKALCGSVIVILNSPSVMELSPIMAGELEADAILWVGTPGTQGFAAMGEILCGQVNPSGKTADIYPADFTKDPSYQNFSYFLYSNAPFSSATWYSGFWSIADYGGPDHTRAYVEYQEDIYLGYRYYETAAAVVPGFVYGELDGRGAIATPGAVTYPFGYGLSYTQFEQHITDFRETDTEITLVVSVTNTGSVAGKDVVQVYYEAPYTALDQEYQIEKAVANLVTFEKTSLLAPNASEEITLTFPKEDMASYCYTRDNGDGTVGCYFLENGSYTISIRANSHDVLDSRNARISADIWYDNSNPRQSEIDAQSYMDSDGVLHDFPANGDAFVAATNQFPESNAYMQEEGSIMSRSDFTGTFPTTVSGRQKDASARVLAWLDRDFNFNYETDTRLGNVPGSLIYTTEQPVSGADNGLSLIDMRGLSYYDSAWSDLLDQVDYTGEKDLIQTLLYRSGYGTIALDSVGAISSSASDGDTGVNGGGASYPCKVIVAATWNKDLAYDMGEAIGREAMDIGTEGWYAPAMNTHRSPFSGRNFEYFSEDGVLGGKLAARMVSGASDSGLTCFIKHFALNDQEAYRHLYIATWATEQAMREIYLKPFEITIKEAISDVKYISDSDGTVSTAKLRATKGIMMSLNAIGTTPNTVNYALQTGVLRTEWGFVGFSITDLLPVDESWIRDYSIRSGLSGWLSSIEWDGADYDSATMRQCIRRSLHGIFYSLVNSAAYNGIAPGSVSYYTTSPWEIAMYALIAAICVWLAASVVWVIYRLRNSKKHPTLYCGRKKIVVETANP